LSDGGLTLSGAQANDRVAEAERELREFSYIVSHDLAASCRHVAEFSRLLMGDLGEGLTGRQQAYAVRISMATDKCHAMMEQLLLFSRVQQTPLDRVCQDPAAALQLARLQLATEIAAAGAEISVGPLGEVFADPALLALTFRHLLDNAIKFRRPGTRPRIAVQATQDETVWRMRITDNGVAVEPPFRDKAFGMFQRLNGEGAYPGVGAGLAICRRIARRHGGELSFLDCAEGACIELTLPRAPSRSTVRSRPVGRTRS
jgi:light-regulated signal transduction histidine kinase (bacteriophytochrome)